MRQILMENWPIVNCELAVLLLTVSTLLINDNWLVENYLQTPPVDLYSLEGSSLALMIFKNNFLYLPVVKLLIGGYQYQL